MKHVFHYLKTISIISLLLTVTGCARVQPGDSAESTYTISLQKSPVSTRDITHTPKNQPVHLFDLITEAQIPIATTSQGTHHVITALDSVIVTASKEWRVYVNGTPINNDLIQSLALKPTDKIEIKYENKY